MSKKTVVFDFDGVIHRYSKGWQDGCIYDIPTPGIEEVLNNLKSLGYEIIIVSTRCTTDGGIDSIKNWLSVYSLLNYIDDIRSTKPPAMVYVDDRAITFDGNDVSNLVNQIVNFKPWNK